MYISFTFNDVIYNNTYNAENEFVLHIVINQYYILFIKYYLLSNVLVLLYYSNVKGEIIN